jgi:hypothetical protein
VTSFSRPHDPSAAPFGRRELIWLGAITLAAAGLRLFRLGEWSLWIDEAHTLRDVLKPAPQFWEENSGYPLSYLLLRGLVPDGPLPLLPSLREDWLRLPFAFFGILSVPLLALIGRPILGARASLFAAALLAVSPWHLYWSQNARGYALVLFFGMLGAGTFHLGVTRRSAVQIGFALLMTLVAGLCHPSGHLLFAAYLVDALAGWRRSAPRPRWLLAGLLLLLLVLTPIVLPLLQTHMRNKPAFSFAHLAQTTVYFVGIPVLIAALGGVLWLLDRGSRAAAFLLTWGIVPLLALAVMSATGMEVTAQYAFATLPAFCLAAAVLIEVMMVRVASTGLRGAILRAVPIAILVLPMLGQDWLYFERQHGDRPRWREAAHLIARQASRDARVVSTNGRSMAYYLNPASLGWSGGQRDVQIVDLARHMFEQAGGDAILREQIALARAERSQLYVVVTEPELYQWDPAKLFLGTAKKELQLLDWLPNWNGPKDMTVHVFRLRDRPSRRVRPLRAAAERPAQADRRHQRRHQHHQHQRRERARVEQRPALQHERGADAGEDQADLAARHHADRDRQPVGAAVEHAQPARELAGDRRGHERRAEPERAGRAEAGDVDLDAHQHEEQRHEDRGERMQQLVEGLVLEPRAHAGAVRVEQDAGRERADDAGEPDRLGGEREREAQRDAGDQDQAVLARGLDRPHDAAREEVAGGSGREQERRGLGHDRERGAGAQPGAAAVRGDHAADHGQHHQAQHVVDDRRAEDHLARARLRDAQVLQHARGDADAGGGQAGAEEHRHQRVRVGQQRPRHPPAERERHDHADQRHQQRRGADARQRAQVGLEADVEQQQQHADLGQHLQRRLVADEREAGGAVRERQQVADADPDQQLAEHRRLAQPHREQAAELRRQQQRGEPEQHGTGRRPGSEQGVHLRLRSAAAAPGRSRSRRTGGSAAAAAPPATGRARRRARPAPRPRSASSSVRTGSTRPSAATGSTGRA